jgi:Rrf2 family protein
MKLTNTSEYALRILSFMTKQPEHIYSAKNLIEALQISDKYLRRIMTNLTKAGFINSIQGRDGGYSFAKALDQIYLSDIIQSVEGLEKYFGCALGFTECSGNNPCMLHKTWLPVRNEFERIIKSTTLNDLDYSNINKF